MQQARLGVREDELRYSEGRYHAGDRSLGFVELAAELGGTKPHPLNSVADGLFGATYPNGCHIAEVEVDADTGFATIARYTVVDDLGHVINPDAGRGAGSRRRHAGRGTGVRRARRLRSASGQLLTAQLLRLLHAARRDDRRHRRARASSADADECTRREGRR